MHEEYTERQMAKMEMQINAAQNKLSNIETPNLKRQWFQTHKEKKDEKDRLTLEPIDKKAKTKRLPNAMQKKVDDAERKSKREEKTPSQLAKERMAKEMLKVSLMRAKLAKSKKKPGKIRSVHEVTAADNSQSARKGRSNFGKDLTDVSRKKVKQLRFESNQSKKMTGKKKTSSVKITNKAGKNKFNQGKNFGGPRLNKSKKGKKWFVIFLLRWNKLHNFNFYLLFICLVRFYGVIELGMSFKNTPHLYVEFLPVKIV